MPQAWNGITEITANAPLTLCRKALVESKGPKRNACPKVAEAVSACCNSWDYAEDQRVFKERRVSQRVSRDGFAGNFMMTATFRAVFLHSTQIGIGFAWFAAGAARRCYHLVALKIAKSLRTRNSDMILKTAPRNLKALLVVPATLWLLVFAVAPLLLLVAMSFWTSTIFGTTRELTLDNYRVIVSDPIYVRVLLQTLRIAATVTLISLLVSYPMAYFIASRTPKTKGMFLLLLFLPFWSSYVVRTFVWLPMLGRNGFVNAVMLKLGIISEPLDWLLYNEGTTHIALVYVYTLFMSLPIYLSIDRLDRRLIEAAADLGAGPFRAFYRVILPLTMPGVLSGCVMVFLLACGAYVTPQLLGGTSGIMFGNIIAPQYTVTNNWALGAALSVVLIAVVFLCLVIFGRRVRLNDIFMGG